MATADSQPAESDQMTRREDESAAGYDDALMKQIQATHAPDGGEIEVAPILHVVETILNQTPPKIHGVGTQQKRGDALEERAAQGSVENIVEGLDNKIKRISCELLLCKWSDGKEAHETTMGILTMLSSYTWDAKIVTLMASFAANYGEFWLLNKQLPTNAVAKSVAVLKRLPDITGHYEELKPRFEEINILIRAMLNVTKRIVVYKGIWDQNPTDETSPMEIALAHILAAVYWTIRSAVACASAINSLSGKIDEIIGSWEVTFGLSSLAQKLRDKHGGLRRQLIQCYEHIDQKRRDQYFSKLAGLLGIQTPHLDNLEIVKALIAVKDDHLASIKKGYIDTPDRLVNADVLRGKTLLLLLSDLDLSREVLLVLRFYYQQSRSNPEFNYEILWLAVLDSSVSWNDKYEQKYKELQSMMPWLTLYNPSLLEPASTRYIKEQWHFMKKSMLVTFDPAGKEACPNALPMVFIWGNKAYPFTLAREETLWKEESWRLEFLVGEMEKAILNWIAEEKYICLYGGDDIEWIRRFTKAARRAASAADISIEMIYMGKSSSKERVQNINAIIASENLSDCWKDLRNVWLFWARLESMLYSKMQQGSTVQSDEIMQEVLAMLYYDGGDGGDQGWAVIGRGSSAAEMAKAKGDTMLRSLTDFATWEKDAREKGFVPALNDYFQNLHKTQQHTNGGAECHKKPFAADNGMFPVPLQKLMLQNYATIL